MPNELPTSRFFFRRQIPAMRIFESAGVALSPSSIAHATLAAALLSLSGWLVNQVLPIELPNTASTAVSGTPSSFETVMKSPLPNPFITTFGPTDLTTASQDSARIPVILSEDWSHRFAPGSVTDVATIAAMTRPWSSVIQPAVQIIGPSNGRNSSLNGAIRFVIALGLWSFAGLFLCRRAAFLFAGNDETTISGAIQYSFSRWLTSFGAPLIPLSATFLIALSAAAMGFVGRLPYLGSSWLIVASPVLLVLGFAMAFLLLATILSWPLMIAAVSVDDCDSFGSLSRAYSCLTGRPWHVLGFTLLGLLVGGVLMSFMEIAASTTMWCAMSSTAIGSGDQAVRNSLHIPLKAAVNQLFTGIGISFFWSFAIMCYLLLRQEVDGVPLDRIAPDDDARPERIPLPVVGIPATDARTESNGSMS